MSSSKLKKLKEYREQILLAEIAGWLHDWQKCIDMAVASHWQRNPLIPPEKVREWLGRGRTLRPGNFSLSLQAFRLTDDSQEIDMKTLCEKGRNPSTAEKHPNNLVKLLGYCHSFAHVEKELEDNEALERACDQIAQGFGFDHISPHELFKPLLDKVLPHLQKGSLPNRKDFLHSLYEVFSLAWGDTRRPINEVTLWDWASAVASLYKAEIAYHFLTDEWRTRNDLRWRILRVNFDVLGLYGKAISIADLLGYQEAIRRACEEVKRLVEEEYPLGNEVYQDTTGIYFTFPDVDLPAELAEEIRRLVEGIEPELAPRIAVGKGTGNTAGEQLRTMLAEQRQKARRELVAPFEEANLSTTWQEKWENLSQGRWEICPVCRLRPMEEGRQACEYCENRRASRVKAWLSDPTGTIWMDEIADHNGRVALIVGKFGLEGWLSGDLVRTMLVRAVEDDPQGCRPKNPSPARLRRVWETCRKFWTDTVEGKILTDHPYGRGTPSQALRYVRMFVTPDIWTDWQENFPYDGTVEGRPISLLWDEGKGHFITIMNLQLSAGEDETLDELADSWKGRKVEVRASGFPRQVRRFRIEDAVPAPDDFGRYLPYLPLLESPDRFLCLVPAHDALDIARKVRSEYVEQMGKVQDRLPLFLGLVFFPRKMPLTAVMDAGTRMLEECVLSGETWKVECVKPTDDMRCYVRLSSEGRRLEYRVPVRMGDGTTEDIWYPYFFFEGDPGERRLKFQLDGRWLVHVCDLKEDDRVRVWPSKFSYTFLEHTARRFAFDPERDVMLLDELPRMMKMWEDICRKEDMTDTKLHAVWSLLDAKWDLWKPDSDPEGREAFEGLVRTTLKQEGITKLSIEDVLLRRFQRCLELHLRILKRRVKEEQNEQ